MRKFVIIILIFILVLLMYFTIYSGFPNLELDFIKTYATMQEEYEDYQTTLNSLEQKNNVDLVAAKERMNFEYSPSDSSEDNVIKAYKENKEIYEALVEKQQSSSLDEADIYDVEYIWTEAGKSAKSNDVEMKIDVTKSESDLDSDDYIMCDLEFNLVGMYIPTATFIKDLESKFGFQINEFFTQSYYDSAKNQTRDNNLDTDNIPTGREDLDGDGIPDADLYINKDKDATVLDFVDDKHAYDISTTFKVYNVPLNKRNVTNIKGPDNAVSTPEVDPETGLPIDSAEEVQ